MSLKRVLASLHHTCKQPATHVSTKEGRFYFYCERHTTKYAVQLEEEKTA